jgi:hypothetical protein
MKFPMAVPSIDRCVAAASTTVISSRLPVPGRRSSAFSRIEGWVRVYVACHAPRRATARVLDQHEADRTLAAYRSRHTRAWERFRPVLEETLGAPITDADSPPPIVELRLD